MPLKTQQPYKPNMTLLEWLQMIGLLKGVYIFLASTRYSNNFTACCHSTS